MLCQQGNAIGADLVGRVAVGGNAVGPHHHRLHKPLAHEERAGIVAGDGNGDIVLVQFPGREARALEEGPRFIGNNLDAFALLHSAANNPKRRAIARSGQSASIAVGEHGVAVFQAIRAKAPQSLACFHIFGLHSGGLVKKGREQGGAVAASAVDDLPPAFTHAFNGPAQVYGCGPGIGDAVKQFFKLGGPAGAAGFVQRKGAAPGRSDANGRSPAHNHGL